MLWIIQIYKWNLIPKWKFLPPTLSRINKQKAYYNSKFFFVSDHDKNVHMHCKVFGCDAHVEKLCKSLFSATISWKRSLAASDTFHMFTQSFQLYVFYSHILKRKVVLRRCFNNLNLSSKWTVDPFRDF